MKLREIKIFELIYEKEMSFKIILINYTYI